MTETKQPTARRVKSIDGFRRAAEKAGFAVTVVTEEAQYKVSVGSSGSRYNTKVPQSAIDAGWESGKPGCTTSRSNFKGTTYWITKHDGTLLAAQRGRFECRATFRADGSFESGRAKGWDQGLTDLINYMHEHSDEGAVEMRAQYEQRREEQRLYARETHRRDFRLARQRAAVERARVFRVLLDSGLSKDDALRAFEGLLTAGVLALGGKAAIEQALSYYRETDRDAYYKAHPLPEHLWS